MSLITCPECGCEVSSKAPSCPKCGVRIAGNVKRCPVCNSFLLMEEEECPKCHTHFIVEQQQTRAKEDTMDPEVEETKPETNEGPTTEDAQPTEKKGKNGVPWILLLLAIILVGAGGFYFWNKQEAKEAEAKEAYELLKECTDPKSFEDFIEHYSESIYIEDVRALLKALEEQEKAWTEAMNSKDVDKIQAFINEYPNSPRLHRAQQMIDSLDWRKADNAGTADSYAQYITKHDNGEYITEAYAAHAIAEKLEKHIQDSIEAAIADSLAN